MKKLEGWKDTQGYRLLGPERTEPKLFQLSIQQETHRRRETVAMDWMSNIFFFTKKCIKATRRPVAEKMF